MSKRRATPQRSRLTRSQLARSRLAKSANGKSVLARLVVASLAFQLLLLIAFDLSRASAARPPEGTSSLESSKQNEAPATSVPATSPTTASTGGPVIIIDIDGPISPATENYVKNSVERATSENAKLLIVRLNTPGGLLSSTKSIVQALLESPVPTVVYVSPSGGSATSAGVFITLAGHLAVMAPGSTIGAAHPVSEGGDDIQGDMRAKIENFAVSEIRAIAEQRGRNVKWAEQAVRESVSITDKEAVTEHVVDFTASDLDKLLEEAEGRTVTVQGKPITLTGLAKAPRQVVEMSLKQRVLNVLCDPNVAILLGLGALLGIGIELYHPGAALPGIVGVICLLLSLVSSQVIPITIGGVLLLLLGAGFFVAEAFMPAFGLWGVSGIICFVLGAIYLVDTDKIWTQSGLGVDRMLVGTVAGTFGSLLFGLSFLALRSRKLPVTTGAEVMINASCTARSDFAANGDGPLMGTVYVMGEYWNAQLQDDGSGYPRPVVKGDKLRVVKVAEGMVLVVVRGQ